MECAHLGCHNLVTSNDVGRPRRFCSPACKTADYRRRRRDRVTKALSSPITCEPGEALMVRCDADPDTQVVLALHEAVMLLNTFERLAVDARPELGAHCEAFADDFGVALMRHFGGALDG